MKKNIWCFVVSFFVVFMFSSCLGPILDKVDSPVSGTASVRVFASLGDSSSPTASRVVAPPVLTNNDWDSLNVTILEGTTVVDETVVASGTSVEFAGLEVGTEYTFNARLLKGQAEVANGSIDVTPVAGSNSVSIPVTRVRGTGKGSFMMDITVTESELIDSVTAELYTFGVTDLEFYEYSQPITVWNPETGIFNINWPDLDAGSYLLSVIASGGQNSGLGENRLLLGEDSLVEIYAGQKSSATVTYNSTDILDSAVRYYVTQNGNGSGQLPSDPITFEEAYAAVLVNPLVTETRPGKIVLLESVDVLLVDEVGHALPLTTSLHISGLTGEEVISRSVFQTYSNAIFVIGGKEDTVWTPGYLTLENVSVSGNLYTAGGFSPRLISVHSGTLTLGSDSVVTGDNKVSGISLGDTSSIPSPLPRVHLVGGSITNCVSQIENGGAISSDMGYGSIILESGTISNCSAEVGGGIYVGEDATLEFQGTGSVNFTGNSATITGGAIAVAHNAGNVNFTTLQLLCDTPANKFGGANNLVRYCRIDTENSSTFPSVVSANPSIPLFVSLEYNIELSETVAVTGPVMLWDNSGPEVSIGINRGSSFVPTTTSTFTVSGAGADLTFSNVALTAQEGEVDASYIALTGGATCTLTGGSSISGLSNEVAVDGLAVYVDEGSTLNINNSVIENCSTFAGSGGAVYVQSNANLNLSGEETRLSYNNAAYGGAIYTKSPVNFITETLAPDFITGNTASSDSGGLYDLRDVKSVKINGLETNDFTIALTYITGNTCNNNSDTNWPAEP